MTTSDSAEHDITVPGAGSVDPADHPPIPFTDAQWQAVVERAGILGCPDPSPWRNTLSALYGHLVGVNRWLNLTRVADANGYLMRHVLDALVGITEPLVAAARGRCVDLGSGGGYPGLPLALALPNTTWLLVDSRGRKVRFLAAAAALVDGQRVSTRAFRGREVRQQASELAHACSLVVTRATGTVEVMAAECRDLVPVGGHLVVWQGPSFTEAAHKACISALPRLGWRCVNLRPYILIPDDPQRVLVVMERC